MASPIETMMRAAIRVSVPADYVLQDLSGDPVRHSLLATRQPKPLGWRLRMIGGDIDFEPDEIKGSADYEFSDMAWLYSSVSVNSYKLDFVMDVGELMFAVECDGHDWHDRTKQQAAYDRSRDRELLLIGIPTMRFTGSEIVHSPERCAADVWAMAALLSEKQDESQFMWREATLAAERRAANPPSRDDV